MKKKIYFLIIKKEIYIRIYMLKSINDAILYDVYLKYFQLFLKML